MYSGRVGITLAQTSTYAASSESAFCNYPYPKLYISCYGVYSGRVGITLAQTSTYAASSESAFCNYPYPKLYIRCYGVYSGRIGITLAQTSSYAALVCIQELELPLPLPSTYAALSSFNHSCTSAHSNYPCQPPFSLFSLFSLLYSLLDLSCLPRTRARQANQAAALF